MVSLSRLARCMFRASAWYVALVLLVFFQSQSALSAATANTELDALLREFPSVEQVSARFPDSGTDEEARVRHLAAFEVLIQLTLRVQSGDPKWMQDQRVGAVMRRYIDARNTLVRRLSQDGYRKLMKPISRTQFSENFKNEVLSAFFSSEWLGRYAKLDADITARTDAFYNSQAGAPQRSEVTPQTRTAQLGMLIILGITIILSAKSSSPPKSKEKDDASGRVRPEYGFEVRHVGDSVKFIFQRSRMTFGERLYWFLTLGFLCGLVFLGLGALFGAFDDVDSNKPLFLFALTLWLPALFIFKNAGFRARLGILTITPNEVQVEIDMSGRVARYERAHIRSIYLRIPGESERPTQYRSGGFVVGTGVPGAMAVGAHVAGQAVFAAADVMNQWGGHIQRTRLASVRMDFAEKRGIMVAGPLTRERADCLFDEIDRALDSTARGSGVAPLPFSNSETSTSTSSMKSRSSARVIALLICVPLAAGAMYWLNRDSDPTQLWMLVGLGAIAGALVARLWKFAVAFVLATGLFFGAQYLL